jgi:anti-sigma B factor antagonist
MRYIRHNLSNVSPDTAIEPIDFALATSADDGGNTVIAVAGELDLYRAPALEDAFQGVAGPVVLDLQEVSFLDSTTLALLVHEYRRRRAAGHDLTVLVGPQTPTTVFAVTGIDRILAIRSAEPLAA